MGCPVNFSGLQLSYACGEISSGGLKTVLLADKADLVASGVFDVTGGVATITGAGLVTAGVDVLALGFNNKDGYSNFTDVKTVNADGTANCVPTIQIEFLRMDASKRAALEAIAVPGAEIVAFVETAAGTYHAVGYEFGMYAATVDGASGASRSDKNRYQLTLVGDENVLAATMTDTEFEKVTL